MLSSKLEESLRCISVVFAPEQQQQQREEEKEEQSRFPFLFLRDNCPCSQCLHPTAGQRLIQTVRDLPLDLSPTSIELLERTRSHENGHANGVAPLENGSAKGDAPRQNGEKTEEKKVSSCLKVEWSDGHVSFYESEWLKERIYNNPQVRQLLRPAFITWRAEEMKDNVPRHEWTSVMETEQGLLGFLRSMIVYGIALIKNVPSEEGQVKLLANHASVLKTTAYGPTFQVRNNPKPSNLAFTSIDLELHTDLSFYNYAPGIQILHCLQQSEEGGSNTFTDAFQVALDLKENDPKTYHTLVTEKVHFQNKGKDYLEYFLYARRPIIKLDEEGELEFINYNNHARASYQNVPPERSHDFYDAYYKFTNLLRDPHYRINLRMDAGDMVVFHNQRVLHGRTAFTISNKPRHLEGGYMDWDDFLSKYRVLLTKQAKSKSS